MNVKAVVKVMNFHALLRVDSSRKKAEKYQAIEEELEHVMGIILNNRNLRLDKLIKIPSKKKPVLRIYIGSDYGFCGSVNSSVNGELLREVSGNTGGERVLIGKKLRHNVSCELHICQEEFEERFEEITGILRRAVEEQPWSAVVLVYNHYYNMSTIKPECRQIYPLDSKKIKEGEQENPDTDYFVEGDAATLLKDMIVTYLQYEIKIAMASSFASENICRQNATSESMRKLDEAEEIARRSERKRKNAVAFTKTVDNYIKQRALAEAKEP